MKFSISYNNLSNLDIMKTINKAINSLNLTSLSKLDGINGVNLNRNIVYKFESCKSSSASMLNLDSCEICFAPLSLNDQPVCYSKIDLEPNKISIVNMIIYEKLLSIKISSAELLSSLEKLDQPSKNTVLKYCNSLKESVRFYYSSLVVYDQIQLNFKIKSCPLFFQKNSQNTTNH